MGELTTAASSPGSGRRAPKLPSTHLLSRPSLPTSLPTGGAPAPRTRRGGGRGSRQRRRQVSSGGSGSGRGYGATAQSLNDDTLRSIFSRLDDHFDLAHCFAVCKSWNTIINTCHLMKDLYYKRNPQARSSSITFSMESYFEALAMNVHAATLTRGSAEVHQALFGIRVLKWFIEYYPRQTEKH